MWRVTGQSIAAGRNVGESVIWVWVMRLMVWKTGELIAGGVGVGLEILCWRECWSGVRLRRGEVRWVSVEFIGTVCGGITVYGW